MDTITVETLKDEFRDLRNRINNDINLFEDYHPGFKIEPLKFYRSRIDKRLKIEFDLVLKEKE